MPEPLHILLQLATYYTPLPKAPRIVAFIVFFQMVQVSKFIVPHALQVHFVFRAGGGGGGSSRPGMPETFERIREKSPSAVAAPEVSWENVQL